LPTKPPAASVASPRTPGLELVPDGFLRSRRRSVVQAAPWIEAS
jgi:hypothetical protein